MIIYAAPLRSAYPVYLSSCCLSGRRSFLPCRFLQIFLFFKDLPEQTFPYPFFFRRFPLYSSKILLSGLKIRFQLSSRFCRITCF